MRIIQDCVKDILPTPEESKEAIEYLSGIMPGRKFCLCNGAVGEWVMFPNGATCFHCPTIALPERR